MATYLVDYQKQLPGWDEFDKVQHGAVRVEADSAHEAMDKADTQLGKYCVAVMAKKVEEKHV